ncbi:MAG: hypothetical protein QF357_11540 [Dehalococcoidia bacterium]|nr:hypothetical protein [Dehalococcoidia bacterium]
MTGRARYIKLDRQQAGPTNVVDTGDDSIYLMHGRGPSWDRNPTEVPVHMHIEVDEMIVMLDSQEGFYLHGKSPESMVKTPFEAPCVLMLPAGEFHRIVTTSEGEGESLLTYTAADSTLETFDDAFDRAVHAKVMLADLPLEELPVEQPVPTNLNRQRAEGR